MLHVLQYILVMFQWLPLTHGSSTQHDRNMINDPNAKPPPPEIIVEGDWPHFLRRPTDPGERARRAQQTADEQREQEYEQERELEHRQRESRRTARGREKSVEKRQQKKVVIIKVAETVILPGTPRGKAWRAARDMLERVNVSLKLAGYGEATTRQVYDAIRAPHEWGRLTSLRRR
jgi:hypothetical protein